MTSTQWERTPTSETTYKYLRGAYSLWACLRDGEMLWTVRPNGERPNEKDSGHHSIQSALKEQVGEEFREL